MSLTRVSASQIKDFKACNRLWFYTRVLGQKPPQTEAQSRGTTVHGALEAHLKAGKIEPEILERAAGLGITTDDLSAYVAAMLPFVGAPGEGLTEHRDEMPTYEGGPKYVLVVDHAREVEVDGRIIPQIDDLKTTSDFRYCKTPDELSKDVQMVSYAKWALWRLFELKNRPPPDFVSLRHVYVRTRGKRIATARDVLVTPTDVEIRWSEILDTVRDMSALAEIGKNADPQNVPATTTDHCSAYGGCFFRVQCFGAVYDTSRPFLGLFHKETKESVMADGNVLTPQFPINGATPPRTSLKDRVAARKAAAPGAASAPAAAPAAVAAVAPAAAPVVATCGAFNVLFPGCACTLMPHEGDHESKGPTGGAIHWSQDGAQFGIGASTNWKPLGMTPALATSAALATTAPTAASVIASFTPSVAPAVLPPDAPPRTSTPEEVAAANASKGRKPRATKAEMEARAAAAAAPVAAGVSVAVAPPVGPIAIVAPAPSTVVATAAPAGTTTVLPGAVAGVCQLDTLYIDSYPTKNGGVAPTLAEGLLAELAAAAAQAAGAPDWRLVEYGKGKGAMAVVLRERLAQVPRELVVSTSTPGSDVLIEVLSPHAKRVVRALRG